MKSESLTLEQANEMLRYDPDTGYLHWKKTNRAHKADSRAGGG